MTTFQTQPATCPNCQGKVNVHILTSTNTFGPRYTDFRSDAAGFQPRRIMMSLCEDCGFAGYTHEFKVTNVLPDEVREKIALHIKPTLDDTRPPMSRVYAIHGQIAEWLGKSPLEIADSYLKAAWCCQDEGDVDREKDYRRIAVSYYKDAINNGTLDDDTEPSITYLVGELYRRTGDSVQAHEWFNKVIDNAKTHAHWHKLSDLAQQQRDNPKDLM
jgi:uncharacterized protein (DUF2225 family)